MKRNNINIEMLQNLMIGFAFIFSIFLVGGLFGKNSWQPFKLLDEGYNNSMLMLRQLNQTHPWLLLKTKYTGDGVTIHQKQHVQPGVTLIQGWFPDGAETRLIDMDGKTIHRWPANFFEIWPNPDHVFPKSEIPVSRFHYNIQGGLLLPDGSIIFNFTNLGTVKLDKCGAVLWKLNRKTHHSVTLNKDGSYWIPAKNDPRKIPEDLLLFGIRKNEIEKLAHYEDLILLVNSQGQVKKQISVLRALIEAGFEQQLFDIGKIAKFDPTHINDIEVVTQALADKLPAVNQGDLLVSIRQLHTLVVMDAETGKIKWQHRGPWVRQHDPEISKNGLIEVFNNRSEYPSFSNSSTNQLPGSHILSLNPATSFTSIIFPNSKKNFFYTDIMGTHQHLENGNRLINESRAGRIFEVNKNGNIVWEYIKPYDDKLASMFTNVIRYDLNYLHANSWSCSGS